jgi:hypothetical protein
MLICTLLLLHFRRKDICREGGGGGGVSSREQRLRARSRRGELDRGLGRGEPFFSDTDSDSDSDETFQISRKLSLVHVEFFCVLVQQPWL